MKKKLLAIVIVLLAALMCVVGYYETHFTAYETVTCEISEEEALLECPSLLITEGDMEMTAAALTLPEVKEALEQSEITEIPAERITPVKEIYGAGADYFCVGTLEHSVYIDINISPSDSDGVRTILSVWPDDAYPPRKTVGVYGKRWNGDRKVTVYENENGEEFLKITEQRRWFAYFRDRMWEES